MLTYNEIYLFSLNDDIVLYLGSPHDLQFENLSLSEQLC